MKTTDQLSREHQAILRGLDLLKAAASSWQKYQAGITIHGRTLGVMLQEHEQGRDLIRGME